MNPRPLDPLYYLHNFQTVLSSLRERYLDLLTDEEREFISRFDTLPLNSRALFVRMMMRNGVLFRASKLSYREIGPTPPAVVPLLDAQFLDDRPSLSVEDLRKLMTKAELTLSFAVSLSGLSIGAGARKPEMLSALAGVHPDLRPFGDWCPDLGDCVYELKVASLCQRFRLMFFGNFRQDWTEFVLAELGIFVYERVAVAAGSRAFSSRSHIDDFHRLYACRELLHGAAPLAEIIAALPSRVGDCEWLEERRQKLLFQIAQACERQGEIERALQIYGGCTYAGARVRQIRLYERLGRWPTAASLCDEVLRSDPSAVERQQAERVVRRLHRRLGLSGTRTRSPAIPEFELQLAKPAAACAVEYCVRDFLTQQEPDTAVVHYVENALINSLFGLLCWRAVFAPVAGAFFHDFHHAPADFSSPLFFRRRERDFALCLAQLESGEYEQTIRETHAAKLGVQSPFVAWGLMSESLLNGALTCFPSLHLRRWFEWIVGDVRINRAGFPDLVQFWPAERRYRLIEVKGPGDRLQDNQRRLLQFCLAHEMPVSVCHVRWAGAPAYFTNGVVP